VTLAGPWATPGSQCVFGDVVADRLWLGGEGGCRLGCGGRRGGRIHFVRRGTGNGVAGGRGGKPSVALWSTGTSRAAAPSAPLWPPLRGGGWALPAPDAPRLDRIVQVGGRNAAGDASRRRNRPGGRTKRGRRRPASTESSGRTRRNVGGDASRRPNRPGGRTKRGRRPVASTESSGRTDETWEATPRPRRCVRFCGHICRGDASPRALRPVLGSHLSRRHLAPDVVTTSSSDPRHRAACVVS
jgi:hypothetical protein